MDGAKVHHYSSDNSEERPMVNDYILAKLRKIEMLPTFPDIVGEVVEIIDDPNSSASDLVKHMDPSMVGEVVRIANTAYFGAHGYRSITSLERAITVIGFQHLSYIVLQMPFIAMGKGDQTFFDRNGFIRHSVACGVLSKAISSGLGIGKPNEAYISGIMHDIGVIIIYRYFRDEWRTIRSLVSCGVMSRVEAERETLSADHGCIGGAFLDLWDTPKPIADGVRFHHALEEADENRENIAVTCMGNNFSRRISLKRDLESFDGFMEKHKSFMESIIDMAKEYCPVKEANLFEKIYSLLRDVKSYTEGTVEVKND
jgi:HD-like signal output (HDOD) protein